MKTKKQPTTSNLKKNKYILQQRSIYFWNVVKREMGIDEKSNHSKN